MDNYEKPTNNSKATLSKEGVLNELKQKMQPNIQPYFQKYTDMTGLPASIDSAKYCYYYKGKDEDSLISKYYKNKLVSKEFADAFSYVYRYISEIINSPEYTREILSQRKEFEDEYDNNTLLHHCAVGIIEIYKYTPEERGAKFIGSLLQLKYMTYILISEELIKFKQTHPQATFQEFADKTELLLNKTVKMIRYIIEVVSGQNKSNVLYQYIGPTKMERLENQLKNIEDKKERFRKIWHYVFYNNKHNEMLDIFKDKLSLMKEIDIFKNSPDGFVLGYNYRYFDPNDKNNDHLRHNHLLHVINYFEDNKIQIKPFDLMDMNIYYCLNKSPLESITNKEIMEVIVQALQNDKLKLFTENDDKYKLNANFILADLKDFTIAIPKDHDKDSDETKNMEAVFGMSADYISGKNIFTLLCEASDDDTITQEFVNQYTYVMFLIIIKEIKFFLINHNDMIFKVHKEYDEARFLKYGNLKYGEESKIYTEDQDWCFFDALCQIIYKASRGPSIFKYKIDNPKDELSDYLGRQQESTKLLYSELDFRIILEAFQNAASVSQFYDSKESDLLLMKKYNTKPPEAPLKKEQTIESEEHEQGPELEQNKASSTLLLFLFMIVLIFLFVLLYPSKTHQNVETK